MSAPSRDEIEAAIVRAVEPFLVGVESIVVHGSVARGDFWPGQSDVDLIVVGPTALPAADAIRAQLKQHRPDAHACTKRQIDEQLALPFDQRVPPINWLQFGLHGFDLKDHHWTVHGHDFLAAANVPLGQNLRELGRARVRGLVDYECRVYPDKLWNWACEALKAGQLYFTMKTGGEPTRDKRLVLNNFERNVPPFSDKDFAGIIWEHYRKGEEPNTPDYATRCRAFIDAVLTAIETSSTSG